MDDRLQIATNSHTLCVWRAPAIQRYSRQSSQTSVSRRTKDSTEMPYWIVIRPSSVIRPSLRKSCLPLRQRLQMPPLT
jgi:hypothetical protein